MQTFDIVNLSPSTFLSISICVCVCVCLSVRVYVSGTAPFQRHAIQNSVKARN